MLMRCTTRLDGACTPTTLYTFHHGLSAFSRGDSGAGSDGPHFYALDGELMLMRHCLLVVRDTTQIKQRVAQQEKERIAGIRARGDDQLWLSHRNLRQVKTENGLSQPYRKHRFVYE